MFTSKTKISSRCAFGRIISTKAKTISAIPQTILFHRRWNSLAKHTFLTKATFASGWRLKEELNFFERASITIDVDVIYAYDNVNKVEESSEDGEVHGVLINSTMYLRESEIKQVAQLIKDEKLRNRVLTLMRSHRRIVSAPEKENRNIREIASAQMLSQV